MTASDLWQFIYNDRSMQAEVVWAEWEVLGNLEKIICYALHFTPILKKIKAFINSYIHRWNSQFRDKGHYSKRRQGTYT